MNRTIYNLEYTSDYMKENKIYENSERERNKRLDCLVCGSKTHLICDKEIKVTYSVCNKCGFIYKDKEYHLDYDDEYREYNTHNNSFESVGYVKMFQEFIKKHINPLKISGKVLDYGSGPGPVLKELLKKKGLDVYDYDPFFNVNDEYLKYKYNLIISTEVIEHFSNPLEEFKHLVSILAKGGYIVVMTTFNNYSEEEFLKWRYRREASHISFFSIRTLEYIAKVTQLRVLNHNNRNVMVFQKK